MSLLRPGQDRFPASLVGSWLCVAVLCWVVWLNRVTMDGLLSDSDTRGILRGIAERGNPWSWFWTDWPLFNHFYRPFPTLLFEWDAWRSGSSSIGFGETNALLVMMSVAVTAWLASVAFRSALFGCAAAGIFCWWLLPLRQLDFAFGAVLVAGWTYLGWRERWPRARWWATGFVMMVVLYELSAISTLYLGTVAWLPGRTATTMTVFALASMACCLKDGLVWKGLGLVLAACALGSYEQAVMLPAVGLTLAWATRCRFGWTFVGLVVLVVAYVGLRQAILPSGPSAYQDQQFRIGPGLWLSLGDYFAPPLVYLPGLRILAESFFLPLLIAGTGWLAVLSFPAFAGGVWGLRSLRRWREPMGWWLASSLAYAPMAFLHVFEHYHFWPMALRAAFVVSLWKAATDHEEALE